MAANAYVIGAPARRGSPEIFLLVFIQESFTAIPQGYPVLDAAAGLYE
jgi:hypothetical protein